MGNLALAQEDLDRAGAAFEEVAGIGSHLANSRFTGEAELGLARLARVHGELEEAEGRVHRVLPPLVERGFLPAAADALELLGALAGDTESWAESARLLAVASAVRSDMGYVLTVPEQARFDDAKELARG